MRHAILKSLVLILAFVSMTTTAVAQEDEAAKTQNESVTRQKRNKKAKYLQKFNSINNYALDDGQHEFSTKAQYVGSNYFAKYEEGASYAEIYNEQTGVSASAQYAYGLSKNISLGMDLGYRSSNQETTVYTPTSESKSTGTIKGISGVSFHSKFAVDLGGAGLYMSAEYTPLTGTSSYDENTREGNAYNEQASLELKTAIAMSASSAKYGFNVSYNLAFDGEDESITSTQRITNKVTGGGGYLAGAFVEFSDISNLNLAATFASANSKKYTKPDGNSWNETPAQQYVQVASALKVDLGQDFSVVPEASYLTIVNKKVTNIQYDQVNFYNFSVGLRKGF